MRELVSTIKSDLMVILNCAEELGEFEASVEIRDAVRRISGSLAEISATTEAANA